MAQKKRGWVTIVVIIAILFLLASLFSQAVSLIAGGSGLTSGNVALIRVEGPIAVGQGSFFDDPVASSERIISQIDEAEQMPGVKAFIFDINSPGGSGVASYEVAQRINQIEVPTVAVIRDMGVSGSYWIASACDTVYANPLSLTGSIGVIGSYLDFSGLLNDYNVSYERLVAGQYKDTGIPFRELTDDERGMIQEKLNLMHQKFIEAVALNRNMTESDVSDLADGSYYLGFEAVDLGLVDLLGTPKDAQGYVESLIGEPVVLARYEYKATLMDVLGSLGSTRLSLLESQNGFFR